MQKKEIIWREILYQATEKGKFHFTQKELSQKYHFSLSTVFNALKIPRRIGAIEGKKGFFLKDTEKLLYLWATMRNLKKDILYKTNVKESVKEIEAKVPPGTIFGAYSAFFKKYKIAPADYDKVYVYVEKKSLSEIKKRFPFKKGYPNLIVILADPFLKNFGYFTPDCQTFVDIWNLDEWYSKEFLFTLKEKILKP